MSTVIRWAVAFFAICSLAQAAPLTPAETREQARAHFKRGAAEYAAQHYDEAIKEYQAAYDISPLPDLLYNLGQAYRMKGDAQQAIDSYNRYLAVKPTGLGSDEARRYVAELQPRAESERLAAERAAAEAKAAEQRRAEEQAAAEKREAERRDAETRAAEKRAVERQNAQRVTTQSLVVLPVAKIDKRQPVYKRWWVWTLTGVVVVSAAVGLGVGLGVSHKRGTVFSSATFP